MHEDAGPAEDGDGGEGSRRSSLLAPLEERILRMVTNTKQAGDEDDQNRKEAVENPPQRKEPSHCVAVRARASRQGSSVSEGAPGRAGLGKEGLEKPWRGRRRPGAAAQAAGEHARTPRSARRGRRAGLLARGGTAGTSHGAERRLPAVMKATKKKHWAAHAS